MMSQDEEVAAVEVKARKKPGRRSFEELNKIRAANGQKLLEKKKYKRTDQTPILARSKTARTREILATMLTNNSKAVINKIINKALDDDDDDQMACLKIIADRVVPVDYFTNEGKNKARNGINIQIVGVGGETIQVIGQDSGEALENDDTMLIEGELVEDK